MAVVRYRRGSRRRTTRRRPSAGPLPTFRRRRTPWRLLVPLGIVGCLFLAAQTGGWFPDVGAKLQLTQVSQGGSQASTVSGTARVVDGDTLDVAGTRVRLNGLAAPERGEPGGREATRFMVDAVRGETVSCQLKGEQSYDRMIGVCFVDGEDLAALAVAAGVARDCPRFSGGRYAALETDDGRRLVLPGYCEVR